MRNVHFGQDVACVFWLGGSHVFLVCNAKCLVVVFGVVFLNHDFVGLVVTFIMVSE